MNLMERLNNYEDTKVSKINSILDDFKSLTDRAIYIAKLINLAEMKGLKIKEYTGWSEGEWRLKNRYKEDKVNTLFAIEMQKDSYNHDYELLSNGELRGSKYSNSEPVHPCLSCEGDSNAKLLYELDIIYFRLNRMFRKVEKDIEEQLAREGA